MHSLHNWMRFASPLLSLSHTHIASLSLYHTLSFALSLTHIHIFSLSHSQFLFILPHRRTCSRAVQREGRDTEGTEKVRALFKMWISVFAQPVSEANGCCHHSWLKRSANRPNGRSRHNLPANQPANLFTSKLESTANKNNKRTKMNFFFVFLLIL